MLSMSEDEDNLRSELEFSDIERTKLFGVMEAAQGPFVGFCASQLRSFVEGYETFAPLASYNSAIKLQPLVEKVGASVLRLGTSSRDSDFQTL